MVYPRDELSHAERIGLHGMPCEVEPLRASLDRADAVLPPVARHEVAPGVADDADAEFPGEVEHIAAEAILVGGLMAGFEDPV